MDPLGEKIERIIEVLAAADKIAILTGAGVSAESGVPTFRQAQTGLWAQYQPTELATPEAFQNNPKLVWEWYAWRRELVAKALPNPGHYALASMERIFPVFTLITQNVDSLHQRAGSQRVIELHGNISRIKCAEEHLIVSEWEASNETPPRCPACGSFLRPDVVWFGENLPADALETALKAARTCDVFFSIGTSGVVEPAASLPWLARHAKAFTIEINPEETPFSHAAWVNMQVPAGEILPIIAARLAAKTGRAT